MTTPTGISGGPDDPSVQAVARKALELVSDGARVGLGSGRAATLFIANLGERVRAGGRISGVATSAASAQAARQAGVPCEVDIDRRPQSADLGINEAAARHGCDLIFIGSHGRSGISGLLLGSVTRKVLAHALG